jgi:hypothetical protein
MAANNCFWSRVHKHAFFSKRFFFLSIAEFLWKNFFLLNPKWRLVSRWRFSHFKITLFSKNPLQAITNSKTKVQIKKILYRLIALFRTISWSVTPNNR